MEDAPLAFDAQRQNIFSYFLAIPHLKLDKLIKPTSRLEEGIGQVKHESRAVALLLGFQKLKEPPDVSEEADTESAVPCAAAGQSSQTGSLRPKAYTQRKARRGSA